MVEATPARPGRNEPCHCGSGKKYKHCCLARDEEADLAELAAKTAAIPPPEPVEETHTARATPPHREAGQPWKRASQGVRGGRRITTPRKAG